MCSILISRGDDYGKYGVTKSNLKQAENQLKSCLQKRRVETADVDKAAMSLNRKLTSIGYAYLAYLFK